MSICPYNDQCGIKCHQLHECCQVKSLFDDFYNIEKRYFDKDNECEKLKEVLNSIAELCKKSLHCDTCYDIMQIINKVNK